MPQRQPNVTPQERKGAHESTAGLVGAVLSSTLCPSSSSRSSTSSSESNTTSSLVDPSVGARLLRFDSALRSFEFDAPVATVSRDAGRLDVEGEAQFKCEAEDMRLAREVSLARRDGGSARTEASSSAMTLILSFLSSPTVEDLPGAVELANVTMLALSKAGLDGCGLNLGFG